MTPERVGMFSDAVFAIAITLLVLEIPRPAEEDFRDLAGFLGHHQGSFVAFVLAFLMLWFSWRAHHTLFDQLHRVSQPVLLLHVPLLLFSAFLPYTMNLWSEMSAADVDVQASKGVALALFAGTEAILMFCQGALFTLALSQGLLNGNANRRRMGTSAWVYWGCGVLWAASAVLAFGVGENSTYAWMATPVVVAVIVFVRRRLAPAAIQPGVTGQT
ncbi:MULTISPECIES: TMEM175 family protein [unclassified Nonomuraea]|uniref:TMEM175 family protein n=1 Tax=Nonomuraea sp. NPDC047529 TaxID=3155623 RepID=UPI003400E993